MEFTIKLDRFEGPYTKLLELIDTHKLSITEVSLATVADDYIAYIKTIDQKNIVDISQFIVVASTLMLMKAKSLLLGVVYTEEEEKQVHDLEYKLELYSLLSYGSRNIRSIYMKRQLYSRLYIQKNTMNIFVPDTRVTSLFLQSVAILTLHSFVAPKALVTVAVEQALRLENVIEQLLERVKNTQSVSLTSLAGDATTKEDHKKLLIVNFIALLELLRTGTLHAQQPIDGGEITILTPDVNQKHSVLH